MAQTSSLIYATLEELGIGFKQHNHPAVYTTAEANQYSEHFPGAHCKNLFLVNHNKSAYYLLVLLSNKRADFKNIAQQVNEKRLALASAQKLKYYLNLEPGAVTPLAAAYDNASDIAILLDNHLHNYSLVNFHPGVNTATLTIAVTDLLQYLAACRSKITWIDVN